MKRQEPAWKGDSPAKRVYDDGWRAYFLGKRMEDNPHIYGTNLFLSARWEQGWRECKN